MVRGVENPMLGGGSNGDRKENLNHDIEIRLADIEKDAAAVARIFNEPKIIQHLAGVAPALTRRNIVQFRENIVDYMPEMPGLDMDGLKEIAKGIIIATKDEIKERYSGALNIELYVAELAGKVVGTATLEKPSGAGMRWGQVSRIAVSESEKGKGRIEKGQGTGTKLLQFINRRMFEQLGLKGASAGIIRGIDGDGIPLHLFENAGYESSGTLRNICLGWSIAEEQFVYRNSIRVQRVVPEQPVVKAA